MDGDEVTQVYVKLPQMDMPMPIKQLKGFQRMHVKKGKIQNMKIVLDKDQLRYWNENSGKFITPKGSYTITVGASSEDIRLSQSINL